MSAFTAKCYQFGRAPKRIKLEGDKARPESAQHIIEFPGGAIELSRTTDGNYWAHIIVTQRDVCEDAGTRQSAYGRIVGSRIGRVYPGGVEPVENAEGIEQIAILIRPTRKSEL
jgi:hypothetical protein